MYGILPRQHFFVVAVVYSESLGFFWKNVDADAFIVV